MIPSPPTPQPLGDEDLARLEGWKAFFYQTSRRCKIVTPTDEGFGALVGKIASRTREHLRMQPPDFFENWPSLKNIAFLVLLDSSRPNTPPEFRIEDIFIFCWDNIAFAPAWYSWTGDGELAPDKLEWSLDGSPDKSWRSVTAHITKTLLQYHAQVPPPPLTAYDLEKQREGIDFFGDMLTEKPN